MGESGARYPDGQRDRRSVAVTQWSRPEYAQPLIPGWLAAIVVALIAIVAAGRSFGQAHTVAATPTTARVQQVMRLSGCGPGWQVRQTGISSYALRTVGAFVTVTPAPCGVAIAPGVATVTVHLTGDAAILSTGAGGENAAPVTANGWYAVQVDPRGDTLMVQPEPHGGDLVLTVSAAGAQ